ncbi:MAG: ComEC/Rec2 family competence protein, partial [Pirellulales bacterium]
PRRSLLISMEKLRLYFQSVLNTCVGSHQAKIASAILLGKRSALSRTDTQIFAATGTIHVLCISGLHISILAYAVSRLMHVFPVPHAWVVFLVISITGCYIFMVGIRIPVLRAAIVIWCACLASWVTRRSHGINALAIAAIIVLVWKPNELFYVGTQLSFLATAVLMSTSKLCTISDFREDPIERLIKRSRSSGERILRAAIVEVQQMFLAAVAVWVVTAPLIAAHFNLFSPVAVFINVLVTPMVALSMWWGLLCLATAWFSHGIASAFGWACHQTLGGLTTLVEIAADVPGAYFWVAGPQQWWLCGWYACIAIPSLFVVPEQRRQLRVWVFVLVSWILLGVGSTACRYCMSTHFSGMRILVTSLGHGCGIVIRGPRGQCLVYDAGRLGAPLAASRAISGILWDEGVKRIDKLVISHADADHFNALPDIMERFWIGELVVSDHFLYQNNAAVREILSLAYQSRIPVRTVARGDSIELGKSLLVRVLHPERSSKMEQRQIPIASDNETSIVASVEAFGKRILLTGDLEGEALRKLVVSNPGKCDILIAPHHGSYTSLPPNIAVVTRPDLVIASGLGGSRWPDVAKAYAYARRDGNRTAVFKTGYSGALRIDLGVQEDMTGARFYHGAWRQLSLGL